MSQISTADQYTPDDSNQNKISPYFLSNLKAWKSLMILSFLQGLIIYLTENITITFELTHGVRGTMSQHQ